MSTARPRRLRSSTGSELSQMAPSSGALTLPFSISMVSYAPERELGMNGAKQFFGAFHERRPGRVEQFIADDQDSPVFHRRDILPCGIFQSLLRLGFVSRGGPGEDYHIRARLRHSIV